jgi:YD repeat-containing protein
MKPIRILILLLIPLTILGQKVNPDIDLNLEGLRKDRKDNGYNAAEIDYFDKHDNLLYTISYDSQGELEDTPDGIAIIHREYDERSNLVQQSYYDENRLRTAPSGPAIIKYSYDQSDNKVETIYCDKNGQPLKNGLAIIRFVYDDNRNITEERHLNSKKQLTTNICIYKYEYDTKGRKIEERCYDNSEKLITTVAGYKSSITRYAYDDQDRVIERTFYNENGNLIDGEAKIVYDYSKQPQLKKTPGFLKDALNKKGAGWVEEVYYDKDDVEIRRSFHFTSNKN